VNYQELDDLMLFRLVQKSDDQAFSVFYDRYVNLVFSIAYTIVDHRKLAEEIVQDVFLKIWKKNHTYQPDQAKLTTWLSAITRNRSIDELRKNKVGVEGKQVSWAEVGQQPDLDQIGPEGIVQLRMDQFRVRRALEGLPGEQRQVIFLVYFYGMTQQQIAEQLGEPLGTVKTRIRLGMQKLRGLLAVSSEIHPK